MIKRYDAYFGSNVSIEQIAHEDPEGAWVKFEDIKQFFGLHDQQDLITACHKAKDDL